LIWNDVFAQPDVIAHKMAMKKRIEDFLSLETTWKETKKMQIFSSTWHDVILNFDDFTTEVVMQFLQIVKSRR
jgi:hypothetical protein